MAAEVILDHTSGGVWRGSSEQLMDEEIERRGRGSVRLCHGGVPLVQCRARRLGANAWFVETGPVALRTGQQLSVEILSGRGAGESVQVEVAYHTKSGTLLLRRRADGADEPQQEQKSMRTRKGRFLADARRLQLRLVSLLRANG